MSEFIDYESSTLSTSLSIQCESKKVASPKTFYDIFTFGEPV